MKRRLYLWPVFLAACLFLHGTAQAEGWRNTNLRTYLGDYNKDGQPDLYLKAVDTLVLLGIEVPAPIALKAPFKSVVLLRNGAGYSLVYDPSAVSLNDIVWQPAPYQIFAADLNCDGFADLLMQPNDSTSDLLVVSGRPEVQGILQQRSGQSLGLEISFNSGARFTPGDWNADGIADFRISHPTQGQANLFIASNGRLIAQHIYIPPTGPGVELGESPENYTAYNLGLPAVSVSASGDVQYAYPIQLPPGINGTQPALSIAYSANGQPGIVGRSWGLSGLSAIHRCAATIAQDGESSPLGLDASDKLCLDGARLQLVSGQYLQAGSVYRTELDGFSRVTQVGSGTSISFEVKTKSGLALTYGGADATLKTKGKVADYTWAIRTQKDAFGNAVNYRYAAGADSLLPTQITYSDVTVDFEQAVVPQPMPRYFGGGYVQPDKVIQAIQVTASGKQVARYKLAYRKSLESSQHVLLASIQECSWGADGKSCLHPVNLEYQAQTTGLRAGQFFSESSSILRGLSSNSFLALDWNGDGTKDFLSTNIESTNRVLKVTLFGKVGATNTQTIYSGSNVFSADRIDIDSDGSDEVVFLKFLSQTGHTWTVQWWVATKSGTYPVSESWSAQNTSLLAKYTPSQVGSIIVRGSVVDLNNDSKEDLILPVNGQWAAYLNKTASGAPVFTKTGLLNGFALAEYNWLSPMGKDPSGGVQLITQKGGVLHGAVLNGGTAASQGSVLNASALQSLNITLERSVAGDFNGDGLADYLIPNANNTISVLLNTGGTLSATMFRRVDTAYSAGEVLPKFKYRGSASDYQAKPLDYDGDGSQEVLFLGGTGQYAIIKFDGGGFKRESISLSVSRAYVSDFNKLTERCKYYINFTSTMVGNLPDAQKPAGETGLYLLRMACGYNPEGDIGDPAELVVGDFNGSGFDGVIKSTAVLNTDPNGMSFYTSDKWYRYSSNRQFPQLLSDIDQGAGNNVEIVYGKLNDPSIYTPPTSVAFPDMAVRAPKPVVSQLLASNGVGGQNATQYRYTGGKLNRWGRGFLGFATVEVKDLARGRSSLRYARQDFPFIGALLKEETYQGGQLLGRTTNTWAKADNVPGKVFFPYLAASNEEQFEGGTVVSAISTSQSFDPDYGNLLSSTTKVAASLAGMGSPPHSKTVTRQYSNDASNWLIGFVTRETETTSAAGVSRSRSHAYTPAANSLAVAGETRFSGTAGLEHTLVYTRDAQGRVTGTTLSGAGIASRSSSQGNFLGPWARTQKNALGHTDTYSYDRASGKPLAHTDANGLTTTNSYDGFGRELFKANPDGSRQESRYLICGTAVLCPAGAQVAIQTRTTNASGVQQGAPERWQYLDQFGRAIRERHQSFAGGWINVDSQYDKLGRKIRQSEPYSQAPVYLSATWDSQDRPLTQQLAGGALLNYSYGARSEGGRWRQYSLTYDLAGSQTRVERRESNALGQLLLSINADGNPLETSARYAYDADGNLIWTQVNGDARTDIRMSYDLAGNRLTLKDPNSGLQRMSYDALGQLGEMTASDGSKIRQSYDLLGRMVSRTDISAAGQAVDGSIWTYDGDANAIGQLSGMGKTDKSFLQVYGYDSQARLVLRQTNIGAEGLSRSYTDRYSYDAFSRPLQTLDASGLQLQHHYNGYGYLIGESNLADGKALRTINAQNARGQVTQVSYGNGVVTKYSYAADSGWLTKLLSGGPQGELQNLSYSYGQNGLLLAREDGRGYREDFDYDILQRLVKSTRTLGSQSLVGNYGYDGLGNLLKNPQQPSLQYGQYDTAGRTACAGVGVAAPGPHAVLRSSAGHYCYDARGNQLSGPDRRVSYSLDDKPLSISAGGQTSEFRYDPERRRFFQKGAARTTFYLDEGQFEEVVENGTRLQNRYLGGYLQFQRNPVSGEQRLIYQLRDQLGSVEATLDASGKLLERMAYAPFGGLRGGNWSDTPAPLRNSRRGFTDHEHLPESGLIHMNGRVYDPSLGRFLSADIVYQDTTNGQAFNRYAYGFNSPFRGVDPTGYVWYDPFSWDWSGSRNYEIPGQSFFNPIATYGPWATGYGLGQDLVQYGFGQFGTELGERFSNALFTGTFSTNVQIDAWAKGFTNAFNYGGSEASAQYLRENSPYSATRAVLEIGLGGGLQIARFSVRNRATGAFLEGARGGSGIGRLAERQVSLSVKGLNRVETHLQQFGDVPENNLMIDRLRSALAEGRPVEGADASFYIHELSESTMMRRGLDYTTAHQGALSKYQVSPYSVYHPDVINAVNMVEPGSFNPNWLKFWSKQQ